MTKPAHRSIGLAEVIRHAELGAKAAVALSLIAYGTGFLIAVQHYSRFSVPVRYVDHVTFLAAGVLFVFMNVVAAGAGELIGQALGEYVSLNIKILRTKGAPAANWSRGKKVERWIRVGAAAILIVLFVVLGPAALLTLLTGWSPVRLLPMVFACVAGTAFDRQWRIGTGQLSRWVMIVSIALFAIVSFAVSTFPFVPAHFGGGRPRLLAKVSIPFSSPLSARDSWMTEGCRSSSLGPQSTPPTVCRMFFRVHETTEFLFLAIAEVDGPCTPSNSDDDPELVERAKCVQRISNATIPRLESIGPTPF